MWTLITLFWRVMSRLLRRVGWGGLLVPVAAMGMALAGVHLWTVALVLIALAVVLRKPLLAAAVLPLSMISAGIAGLVVAAMSPSGPVTWMVQSLFVKPQAWAFVKGQNLIPLPYLPFARFRKGPPPRRTWSLKKGPRTFTIKPGAGRQATVVTPGAGRRVNIFVHGVARQVQAGPAGARARVSLAPFVKVPPYTLMPRSSLVYNVAAGPGRFVGSVHSVAPGAGWWQGKLLVPVALILLTVGLLLAPRMFRGLRPIATARAPEVRQWLAANRWALLLVPVVATGMIAFGVQPPWTLAAVAAVLLIVIRWPVIAADLVPFALAALAAIGYLIASHWQSAPGIYAHPMFYGPVWVDGPGSALAAGAEASAFLALGAWLVPRTIGTRWRTGPSPDADLVGRVARLTETRDQAVDAAAAELRRIERDLHDGAQARLVALGMNLRAVERVLPASPQAALALVAEARETSVRALNELRDLIRGICPPVLSDRGLGHAVQALVLDTPMPTALEVDLPGRLSAPVESACYFAVAEALANAVKHSGARHAGIRIRHARGLLRIEVADDGVGGADPEQGTGLRGVERRLATFDGILAVSSPPGGPTMIVMEVPCALLSPKTSSS
jgi:signal transduction histidine kinase